MKIHVHKIYNFNLLRDEFDNKASKPICELHMLKV